MKPAWIIASFGLILLVFSVGPDPSKMAFVAGVGLLAFAITAS